MTANADYGAPVPCTACGGMGGGYVRTGADDQWDSETCGRCGGTGNEPPLSPNDGSKGTPQRRIEGHTVTADYGAGQS